MDGRSAMSGEGMHADSKNPTLQSEQALSGDNELKAFISTTLRPLLMLGKFKLQHKQPKKEKLLKTAQTFHNIRTTAIADIAAIASSHDLPCPHLVLDRVHQLHCPSDLRAVRFGPPEGTVTVMGCQGALTQIQELQLMQKTPCCLKRLKRMLKTMTKD